MSTPRALFLLALLFVGAVRAAAPATTVDNTDKHSYGANIGWINWQGDVTNGANFNEQFVSGYIWSANTGWINLGDGSPDNGTSYSNTSATDFGVNVDATSGVNAFFLSGYAYSANLGWINFSVAAFTGGADGPRIIKATGIMRGYVYSANAGWISLNSEPLAKVQTGLVAVGTPTPSPSPSPTPSPSETPSPVPTESLTPSPSPTPFDAATSAGHTIPAQIPTNHGVPVQISVINAGNTTWTTAGAYSLAITTDTCGLSTTGLRVGLPDGADVAPGGAAVFSTILRGPVAPGECMIVFQMQNSIGLFGDPITANVTAIEANNSSIFLSNTIPSTIAPDVSLLVGIVVQNNGNTTWTPELGYSLAVQVNGCGLFPSNRVSISPGTVVKPGNAYQFIGQINAPSSTGPCTIQLQMIEENVQPFGPPLDLTIQVALPPNGAREWILYE